MFPHPIQCKSGSTKCCSYHSKSNYAKNLFHIRSTNCDTTILPSITLLFMQVYEQVHPKNDAKILPCNNILEDLMKFLENDSRLGKCYDKSTKDLDSWSNPFQEQEDDMSSLVQSFKIQTSRTIPKEPRLDHSSEARIYIWMIALRIKGSISDDTIQQPIQQYYVWMIFRSIRGALVKVPNGPPYHIGSLLVPFCNKFPKAINSYFSTFLRLS